MTSLRDYLIEHWLAVAIVAVGVVVLLLRRRGNLRFAPGLIGLGGLVLAPRYGPWLFSIGAVLLLAQISYLAISTRWYRYAAMASAVALALGLGAWASVPLGADLAELAKTVRSLELVEPLWLLLLAVIPVIVLMSFRSLAGLGPVRRWVVIGLRSLVVAMLILALAEVRLKRPGENTTVLFLVDRSLSIPSDLDTSLSDSEPFNRRDKRWRRIKQFVNDSVYLRGPGHERDQAGVIVFGRRPRLILPPAEVPRLNFSEDVLAPVDENYTDIAAALKLAIASFPEGSGRRIVLLSDGNENLGLAEEQARVAAANGVQIDVVPLAAGYRNENEVLVQRVEAPAITEQGGRLPIRVLVRSYNPNVVTGELALRPRAAQIWL